VCCGPLATLDGKANAAVGHAHHLQDAANCSDRANIIWSGTFEFRFVLQEQTNTSVA